jgi:hypothetical protein
MVASDRRWCLWGIQDHTGGPERLASSKPIFDVAPALLAFYPFSCAVVRLRRMTHWWRSQFSRLTSNNFTLRMSIIFDFATSITFDDSRMRSHTEDWRLFRRFFGLF